MASVPATMTGVLIEAPGDATVMKWNVDLPVPELKEGQILVKNEWVGVNYIDTYFRTGLYPAKMPFITGSEAAGIVIGVHPSVNFGFKPGDRVAYQTITEGGAYAQYAAINAVRAFTLPDNVSTRTGATALLQGLTAVTFVEEAHTVKPDDWVLVHAAAGGVGSILCAICKDKGAKVIGTAGNPEKMEVAKKNGAQWVINSRSKPEDLIAQVREITGGHGVDAVFDGVGKATFDANLELAARKATVVMYGNASGAVPPVDILRLGGMRNLKLCRPTNYGYSVTREEFVKYCAEVFDYIEKGIVKLDAVTIYPLQDAVKAHQDLEGRKTTGKLIMQVP